MISIVNYGCGNTHAFINAYKKLNIPAHIVSSVIEVEKAKKIILPGVGSFDYVMNKFNQSGLRQIVEKKVLSEKIDVLGICAGMQIFAGVSDEGQEKGLGWINGQIKLFDIDKIKHKTKIPHMGWNRINAIDSPIFNGIDSNARFYFVHSYYFDNYDSRDRISSTDYAGEFTSAIKKNNIYGVQFHPEKSHQNGLTLLNNFAKI
jgi:imidazole glycerol-phosphate synthase subunit HisH